MNLQSIGEERQRGNQARVALHALFAVEGPLDQRVGDKLVILDDEKQARGASLGDAAAGHQRDQGEAEARRRDTRDESEGEQAMKRKRDYEEGSGNVFADLGFRNSKQELLKAKLTVEIYKLLKKRGM